MTYGRNAVNVSNYTHYTSKGRFSENINADVNAGKFSSYTSYQRREADNWQVNDLDENGYNTRRPETATYFKKGKKKDENGNPIYEETQAYTYNMAHETCTYSAGAKYMINKSDYIDADFFADNYTSKYDYFLKTRDFERGDKETRKETTYYDATVKGIFKPNTWNKVSTGQVYQ